MTHSAQILSTLSRIKTGTHVWIADNCGLTYTQVGARMRSLQRQGKVIDTGRRIVVSKKCTAIVWGVVDGSVIVNEGKLF